MAQQYSADMYQDYNHQSRSPVRGYNGTPINRQPSRQFMPAYNPPQVQNFFPPPPVEDYDRYDTGRGFERMNSVSSMQNNSYQYEQQNNWNYNGANGGAHTIGGMQRQRNTARRPALPNGWNDPQITSRPFEASEMHQKDQYEGSQPTTPSDELIPTALVIKNIPFSIKKESLLQTMTDMALPLPYAFNYHFDGGVFRGLAFANYTTAEETAIVIDHLHGKEVGSRKLRVEYKKMLPADERDKIEREKRQRRGQLQEQHQPPGSEERGGGSIHGQASMASLTSNNPQSTTPAPQNIRAYDLNDPATLNFYNQLLVFKTDATRDHLVFPVSISPEDRRTIHTLAHNMNLEHRSEGVGPGRCVTIAKTPVAQVPNTYYTETRNRILNRAATLDLSEVRESLNPRGLRPRNSEYLGLPNSPGSGFAPAQNLRAAKSYSEMRSYTPSPAPSSASFPVGLIQNITRFTDYNTGSAASGTPNLTPTSAERSNGRDDAFLLNGLNSLGLGFDHQSNLRNNNGGRIGQERETFAVNAGPIGSHRPTNGTTVGNTYDENSRNGATAVPERQPRGPGAAEWGNSNGFSRPRQNGHVNRGSGDSSDRSVPRYI